MINDDLSKKKSPHFREKYLVLSYLKTNTWDNCRRMFYWTKHDFVSHPLPLLSFILFFFLQTLNQTQQKQHHEDIHMLSCFRRNYCQSPSFVASRVKRQASFVFALFCSPLRVLFAPRASQFPALPASLLTFPALFYAMLLISSHTFYSLSS